MHGGGGAQMTSDKSAPLPGGPPAPSWLPGAAGACRTAAQEVGRGRAGRSPSHPPAPHPRTPTPPHPQGSSHLPQQLKFTTSDSCDRIKDEFQLLQAQYHR